MSDSSDKHSYDVNRQRHVAMAYIRRKHMYAQNTHIHMYNYFLTKIILCIYQIIHVTKERI
jgi:hypothetical protein